MEEIQYYNKPYIWSPPDNLPIKQLAWTEPEDVRNSKAKYFLFTRGSTLSFNNRDLVYEAEVTQEELLKYDCIYHTRISPFVTFVNSKILNELCSEDFQSFPIIIKNAHNSTPTFENRDYWVINITNLVDSIDKEKTISGGGPDGLRKLVFKENTMDGHHLSRDVTENRIILASPTLMKIFKENKVTGVQLIKDYESYPCRKLIETYHHGGASQAQWYLVSILSNNASFTELKKGLHKIPKSIINHLIEIELSRSNLHRKECEEILDLLKENPSIV